MEHLDLAGVTSMTTFNNWSLPMFEQQDAIYLSNSRQILEPIMEETSEDEERAQNSWTQYEQSNHFWSSAESETGSVIRIELNKDPDSISERDFVCPPKRPRHCEEVQSQQLPNSLDDTVILRRYQRNAGLSNEYNETNNSLERFLTYENSMRDSFGANNQPQRNSTGSRRFDDFYSDSDSLSYHSLSRSSSLIQFESLERQLLLQEQHASMSSLGNSSPSLLSFDGANVTNNEDSKTGASSGCNSGSNSRRGSQSSLLKRFESSDGRLHQTYFDLDKLNFDEDEHVLFRGASKTNIIEATIGEIKSDSESSTSSTRSSSGNSILTASKPSAEDLTDSSCAISTKIARITAFQRGGKNSAENLSEDSGYCEPSTLRRAKSKSIPKNFEKFCEEEEEFQQQYEYKERDDIAQQKHSINYNTVNCYGSTAANVEHNELICQPKINDTTFLVESTELTFNEPKTTASLPATATASASATAALQQHTQQHRLLPLDLCQCFNNTKNSPTREIIEHRRSLAHSPSPVSSEASGSSSSSANSRSTRSSSSSASTCASAASFTWLPIQDQQQQHEKHAQRAEKQSNAQPKQTFEGLRPTLRNSLPDIRDALSSEVYFSYSQQPPASVLLNNRSSYLLEYSSPIITTPTTPTTPTAQTIQTVTTATHNTNTLDDSDISTSSVSSAHEHDSRSDETDAETTPEIRKRSVGVGNIASNRVGGGGGGGGGIGQYNGTRIRISSVPNELDKLGRKKRSISKAKYNKTPTEECCRSTSDSSSIEEEEPNCVRITRSSSLSERRERNFPKFEANQYPDIVNGTSPHSQRLPDYMNASYQDLTLLDYTGRKPNSTNKENIGNQKRAGVTNMEKRKSAGDYEHIICKGNFLLDELSEIFDKNASILNDKHIDEIEETHNFLQNEKEAALHCSPKPPPRQAKHVNSKLYDSPDEEIRQQHNSTNASYFDANDQPDAQLVQHVQLTIRKPPARHKNNRKSDATNSLVDDSQQVPQYTFSSFGKTFDQDPTNLRTSYAQSLEKCNFDPKEVSNTDLSKVRAIPKRRFQSQAAANKKRNLVSSTPNLNAFDPGADDIEDDMFVSSAHTSMHQLPQSHQQKPLGILLTAGSRTSFGKEVSFCPVVSKYSWQEQSSEECNEPQLHRQDGQEEDETDDELLDNADATVIYNTKENQKIATRYYEEQATEKSTAQIREQPNVELLRATIINTEEQTKRSEPNNLEEQITSQMEEKNIAETTKLVSSEQATMKTMHDNNIVSPTATTLVNSLETATTEVSLKPTTIVVGTVNGCSVSRKVEVPNESPTNIANNEKQSSRPLSIQLPILSEPPTNRAHHILYASQQMLDNFQRREREEYSESEDNSVLNRGSAVARDTSAINISDRKSKSVSNLHFGQNNRKNMSKKIGNGSDEHATASSNNGTQTIKPINNNNELMKSKFKADEKHPNSKGFLSRFANGFRFSLRRNKKKQLQYQKELQQQQLQYDQQASAEHNGNTAKGAPQVTSKSTTTASNRTSTPTKAGKSSVNSNASSNANVTANTSDFIFIPLKGPLPAARATALDDSGNTVPYNNNDHNATASTTTTWEDSNASTASAQSVNTKIGAKSGVNQMPQSSTMKVTGKPPLPKHTLAAATAARSNAVTTHLAQNGNSGMIGNGVDIGIQGAGPHAQHQQQTNYNLTSMEANAKALAQAETQSQSQSQSQQLQPQPQLTERSGQLCQDFLEAECSYYYDDFKNQLNSGMQASGCAGTALVPEFTSPSRASVSQKTQMFNNMSSRGGGGGGDGGIGVGRYVINNSAANQYQQQQPQPQQSQQSKQFNQSNNCKIGLIETNLDTHETIITGKTRSLMDIGPQQMGATSTGFKYGKRLNAKTALVGHVNNFDNVLRDDEDNDDDDDDDDVYIETSGLGADGSGMVIKSITPTGGQIASVRRPHKSMEFLLDKENQKNVLPPENELQKARENNPAALSEHQLRIQASLQRLNIPDWFRQYNQTTNQSPEVAGNYKPGNFTRKKNNDSGRWTGLNSKTTSLSSLGSQRSDRSPLLLSPSAHSHHGGHTSGIHNQSASATSAYGTSAGSFSRWSTSHLNSSQTSPNVSSRGSFTRGGLVNSSFMSVTSGNSGVRNSLRQPYLGWRSQEKLSQRTPHERLASSLLAQQRTSPAQRTTAGTPSNGVAVKLQPVTPEIQSSIKEVTSAIVHYVNDKKNQQRSRSTSPNSRKCWLESSFVGIRPLDSPQTPIIENSTTTFNAPGNNFNYNSNYNKSNSNNNNNNLITITTNSAARRGEILAQATAGAYGLNKPLTANVTADVLHMNGLSRPSGNNSAETGIVGESAILISPERSLSTASLEDVLASLLGLSSNTTPAVTTTSASDAYARSTTGASANETYVNYRHMPHLQQKYTQQPHIQQLQQLQQLQVNSQAEQQRLRRRSEGDAPNQQKQKPQQQYLPNTHNAKATTTTTTGANSSAAATTTARARAGARAGAGAGVAISTEEEEAAAPIPSAPTYYGEYTRTNTDELPTRRVSLGDSTESTNNKTTTSTSELLPIKCRNTKCDRSATPADAKKYYKSCHNCTHLYCSRECRRAHWEKHRKACLHSRASNLCRQVLATCKDDLDSQRHLSLLARKGFLSQGRGVVRVLFRSAEAAEGFIKHGFQCMGEASYVRWPDLMPSEMGLQLYAELLKLSTEYKPESKMLIFVAICVVSEAPGMGQAPVRWERQLVSRCAKLKLCKTILVELDQQHQALLQQQPLTVMAVPEPTTEILILTFNPNLRGTRNAAHQGELILSNILDILSRRGVLLRKHYPEIYQRLQSYTEGQTDRFNPVTLHPRDSHTGQGFVCIIMPVHNDSEIIRLPSAADGGNRVTTIDVGSPAALAQFDDDDLLTRSTS
ncbi:uncharacterized protein LOC119688557 [Teleopsis dalmanni]|uniref:uncharacterized protein LOC119688557 n=1 Tax=Teleopsis dalmanni TaxID=139649 RepID=UPI0018CCC5F7|nr:uncharacterized protein LOC119688557 [Teleopsis dalmanni]